MQYISNSLFLSVFSIFPFVFLFINILFQSVSSDIFFPFQHHTGEYRALSDLKFHFHLSILILERKLRNRLRNMGIPLTQTKYFISAFY